MLFRKVGLEEQLGVGILLIHVILLMTVVGIQLVHREISHQGYVRTMLRIKDEGMLHVALIAVGLYVYLI